MKLQKRSAIFNLGAIIKIGALSTIAFLMLSNFWSLGAQAMDPVNGTSGDCTWEIDTEGNMVIKPTSGEECTLANSTSAASMSYHPYRSSITTIKFEDKVYANTGAAALFRDMTNLTDIDLTNFNTSNATNMAHMFRNASSLTEINVSSFDTSSVTDMQYMFNGTSLTSLDLSNFNTSQVTNMSMMFGGLDKYIVYLNIGNFNTANVVNMFFVPARLQEIVLGPETDLKDSVIGRGLWRNKDDGVLYRGIEIKQGPGDFVKVSNVADDMSIPYTVDYRINSIPKIDEFSTTNPEIFTMSREDTQITATLPLEKVSEYSVPGSVELLFKGVVSDKYGNYYDLKMTIENIKFYDLDRINGDYSTICALIVNLQPYNELRVIRLNGFLCSTYDCSAAVNRRGRTSRSEDVTFSILKDGLPVEGSYLFSAFDLDNPSSRDQGSPYDTSDRGYGNYSEGINLNEGFDLDTVVLSQNTMLQKIGENRYTGTGSDNETERSELVVKADAKEAKFTWTTPGDANTTLFANYQPNIVEIAKKDQYGDLVAGATLTASQDGEIRQTWTSSLKPERLWLNPGVYYLKEVSAPEGYEKTDEEIEFIVDGDNLLLNDEIVSNITLTNQKKPTPPKPDEPDTPYTPETPDTPGEETEPEDSDPAVPDTGHNTSTYNQSNLTIIGSIMGGILLSLSGLVIYKAKSTARKFD
ncbi:BspA family leucine-rich repeat surface protein [Candidatus Saccharibacteria bacterium]|nr:BspA family leucine-rich repeat surface protein [Candidatus Saccharibacteria bacterium]